MPAGSMGGASLEAAAAGTMKHAAATASSATSFIRLSSCCVRSPERTPTHWMAVKPRTTEIAVTFSRPASDGTSWPVSSPSAIPVAAMAPHDDTQSVQPTTNAGYSPSARRANTYCPPDFGIITASSAIVIAPSSAYTPPASHAPMNQTGCGSAAATSPGVRRIPTPMVLPTMIASPKATPRTFRRRDGLFSDIITELTIYA